MKYKYKDKIKLVRLQIFLRLCGIKYFKATELVTGLDKGNKIPIRSLWKNIIPALRLLDQARIKYGRMKLNSCYRCESYNKKRKGTKNSYHIKFMAADVDPLDADLREVVKWINDKLPADSWGLKMYNTFFHLDNRNNRYRKNV